MAKLQGTILASKIVPTDSLDDYATHEDKYGRGGHRSVDTLEERDNITVPRRKEGMTVYVKENKTKYILENGIENANWKVDGSGDSSFTLEDKTKLASIDINKIDNDIFDLEKRPYFMGRFQDEDDMLSLFFYDGNEEDDKKLIYNDMYYYNIGLNSVMYYNGGTWIKGNNLNIVDDLNSTVPGSVLDANQGRILKGLIDNITTMLNSDETSLDTIQEIVDFIKINRDTLNALTISSIAGLDNALNNKLDKNQNAISATKLATPVKINNKFFDGSTNINLEEDAMVVKEKVVNLTGDVIQTSLGSVFIKTITNNTTLSLTTSYNTGEVNSFILELINGGNYTINWWSDVKWDGGVAPELTNNGKDILGFYSYGSPRVTIGVVLSNDVK